MSGGFDQTQNISINGLRLAVAERGNAAPLLLIHGGVSDLRTWSDMQERLSGKFRTLAYSRRYARPNQAIAPDADDPMDPHVEDAVQLLQALEAAPAHIVGHSWGGFIALLLAIRHPDLVRRLILIEPPVLTLLTPVPPPTLHLLRLALRFPRMALAIAHLGATGFAPAERAIRRGNDPAAIAAFGRGVLGRRYFDTLSPERLQQVRDNFAPDRAQILGSGFPQLTKAEVQSVTAPVLLLGGADSPAVFKHLNNYLAGLLPRAQHRRISGASHIVHEDAPEQTAKEILRFLGEETS